MSKRVQVIGAHSADFVWRAGGAVAKAVALGGVAEVIALSYGERGESGELWKQEGQTLETVKRIRHAEAEAAAAHLGASFRCLDCGDYPLQIDGDRLLAIADVIREFAPDVLITHTDTDPFNPDHPVAYAAVDRARSLAAGAGVPSAFGTITPPQLFLFEPHQPELCNFTPTVHVDITSVWEQKVAAMGEMQAQQYLQTYYAQRGEQRGNHARRASGQVARSATASRSCGCCRRSSRSCRERRVRAAGRRDRLRSLRPAGAGRRRVPAARPPLARVRAGADRALRAGRQPDGPRRDGRAATGRGARARDAGAAAGRAARRPAAHAGRQRAAPPPCSSTRPCATPRSSPRWPCPCGRAGSARAAPRRTSPGSSTCRWSSAGARSARATSSCSTPTA